MSVYETAKKHFLPLAKMAEKPESGKLEILVQIDKNNTVIICPPQVIGFYNELSRALREHGTWKLHDPKMTGSTYTMVDVHTLDNWNIVSLLVCIHR